MQTPARKTTIKDAIHWFDPRNRQPGTWMFILNRITAIGLTIYLYMHLIVLGQLARGPEGYDNFIASIKSPVFIFGEWLVVAAGFIHGLNGIRVILNSFGIMVPQQKMLLYGLMAIAVIASVIFLVRMFTA
jgi:succinate dehydrogenase / fumarate reductase, cytochrome b subunit